MATTLTLDEHLEALRVAADRLARRASAAGDLAPVPTCPAWSVRALLAHIAMIHDWAANNVEGVGPEPTRSETDLMRGGDDLQEIFATGVDRLIGAIRRAPTDLEALVFLLDAPPPRAFWARRQAHETTIHAVDALAACLGRVPTCAEAAIPTEFAVDGIDELLCGFIPRGRSRWDAHAPLTVAVRPSDSDRRWTLAIGAANVAASGRDAPRPDAVWSGLAAQIYLGLWNRGAEIEESGDVPVLETFGRIQRVRWT